MLEGVLVIGAVERDPTVDLALRRDYVLAFVHGGPSLRLPWEHHAPMQRTAAGDGDTWCLAPWVTAQSERGVGGGLGISLRVRYTSGGLGIGFSGRYTGESSALRECTMTPMRRLGRLGTDFRSLLPISSTHTRPSVLQPELMLLTTLCTVLRDRRAAREMLEDGRRMERLARGIEDELAHRHRGSHGVGAVRRESTDVVAAMRMAGLQHRYGRPVHAGEVVPFETAVAQVIERLEDNPYRADRTTDRDLVERIVRRAYSDVEPWPFAALFD